MSDMRRGVIDRLEPELGSLMRRLEMSYRRGRYSLERAHYLLLSLLQEGGLSTGEIAERLGLDHSTVVRQVAAIEQLGLASRSTNPHDRRSVVVEATAAGKDAAREMREKRRARLEAMLSGWSQTELTQFADLLERFNQALIEND